MHPMLFVLVAVVAAIATGYVMERLATPKPIFWLVAIVFGIMVYFAARETYGL